MKKILLPILLVLGCIMPSLAEEIAVKAPMNIMRLGTYSVTGSAEKPWPKNSSYTESQVSTNTFWGLDNFNNNNNGWAYAACGRKNIASVGQLYNRVAIPEQVTRVEMSISEIKEAGKINSIYLRVGDELGVYGEQKVEVTPIPSAAEVVSFNIPADLQGQNKYYRVYIDCKSASKNALCAVQYLRFYTDDTLLEGNKAPWNPPFEEQYAVIQGRSIDLNALVNEVDVPTLTYSIQGGTSEAGILENGIFTASETADNKTAVIEYTWEETDYYAAGSGSVEITVIHEIESFVDVLDASVFGASGTRYDNYTWKSDVTGISYAANFVLYNGAMQMNNNKGGIIVTENPQGYYLARVDVSWNVSTKNGTNFLEVYGNDKAYADIAGYMDSTDSEKGVRIANLVDPNDTDEIWTAITTPFQYIGMNANDGVEYIDQIQLHWVKREAAVAPAPIEVPNAFVWQTEFDDSDPEGNVASAGYEIAIAVPDNFHTFYEVYFNGDKDTTIAMPDGSVFIRPGEYGGYTFEAGMIYVPTVVAYRDADNTREEKEADFEPFLLQPNLVYTEGENGSMLVSLLVAKDSPAKVKIHRGTSLDYEDYTGTLTLAKGEDVRFYCEAEYDDAATRAVTTLRSPVVMFANDGQFVSAEMVAADAADARYFDLQGREVKAQSLGAGIYIKVLAGKAEKILVK